MASLASQSSLERSLLIAWHANSIASDTHKLALGPFDVLAAEKSHGPREAANWAATKHRAAPGTRFLSESCGAIHTVTYPAMDQRRLFMSETSPLSKKHRERRLMTVTTKQMFDVVADVDNYKHFVPWCRKSEVTNRISDCRFEAELEVGFNMFSDCFTSRVTVEEPRLVLSEAADTSVFRHLHFRWEFAPGPTAGTTWTTFSVDYSFRNRLYASTSVLFFDQVVAKMIKAFSARCKDLYGGRTLISS
jgi:coenzyme Q-binding protein COQ10